MAISEGILNPLQPGVYAAPAKFRAISAGRAIIMHFDSLRERSRLLLLLLLRKHGLFGFPRRTTTAPAGLCPGTAFREFHKL